MVLTAESLPESLDFRFNGLSIGHNHFLVEVVENGIDTFANKF